MKRDKNKIKLSSTRKRWSVEKDATEIRVLPEAMNLRLCFIKYILIFIFCLPFILLFKPFYIPVLFYALFVFGFAILDYADWSDRQKGPCFLCNIEKGTVELPRNKLIVQLEDVIGLRVAPGRGENNAYLLVLQYSENAESREFEVFATRLKYVNNIGNEIAAFTGKIFTDRK